MAKSEGTNAVVLHPNDVPWLLRTVSDQNQPKSVKEAVLARIRAIEKQTGKKLYGDYNGGGVMCRNPSEYQRMFEEGRIDVV